MIYLEYVDSTNTYLKKLAKSGALDRTAVLSSMQTFGKGRMTKSFFSPANSGLYMSILLRSKKPETHITTMAAVAVCNALEKRFPINAQIKWVNDIFINGKKVCGILTEGVTCGKDYFSVLGIGINVFEPHDGFPEDLKNIAGSVCTLIPDKEIIKNLADEILKEFFVIYKSKNYIDEYRRRCFIIGKAITLPGGEKGVAADIDNEVNLIFKKDDGQTVILKSGEIKLLYE